MINRLESIELQGIKTFATLTRLEFPGQITAIVGPNGSGKSNIADSIRWALGEQSYSMLRAKRTEDIIFAGSEQRSRAGMAAVTITFNNEDGWLPIDYSAVSISRRAYRDGQNEYLLNGQKIRLKDITELLAQTGLAERTYTIIGQGLVDVALALKPDERRKLFEEAAGIGLYRSRKEEALRRLESTRQNLNRILDIMTEIRPRLRSLEKQAGRFVDYQRLSADLQENLRLWYGFHWHQKQQDLWHIRNTYRDQEKRLFSLREKAAEVEAQVQETRATLQENRKALEIAHRELSSHHHRLEQATRELAILEERQHAYIHQKNDLEIDISNLEEEVKELESQASTYKDEINQRSLAYEAAQASFSEVEERLARVTEEEETIKNALENTRRQQVALETEKVQINARMEERRQRIETFYNEKEKIEKAIEKIEYEHLDIKRALNDLTASVNQKQEQISGLEESLSEKSRQLADAKREQEDLENQIKDHTKKTVKLQAEFDVLKQAEAALSGYSQGSKAIIDYSRKGQLPLGIEPLSKYIIVEEKYERAIAASLGGLADLLIVPAEGTNVVVEFLDQKESDRVALILLDHLKHPPEVHSAKNREGFLGYANELMQVNQDLQYIVDALFSDILVMKDKQSARKIQAELVGDQKAVTLSGLVFQANGVVISGHNASGKRIGRTRRLNEMEQDLGHSLNQLQKLEAKNQGKLSEIADLQNEVDGLKSQAYGLEQEKANLQQDLQNAKIGNRRLDEQLTWHNEQLTSLQQQLFNTKDSIFEDEKKLQSHQDVIENFLGEEQKFLDRLNLVPVFDLQQELNQWQTHCVVAENALNSARQRYTDHYGRLKVTLQRFEILVSRKTTIEQQLNDSQKQEQLLREEISQINDAIEGMKETQITPLTSTNAEIEQKANAFQKLADHHHEQVMLAERKFTQNQLELERCDDQINHLKERIESEFGLVSYEYDSHTEGSNPLPFQDGWIENLPRIQEIPEAIEEDIKQLKGQIRRIGAINPEAQQEYLEVKERYDFLTEQIADLEKAIKDLHAVIDELDGLMERDFISTFKAVNHEFSTYFTRLFNGGDAKLVFSDDENPVEGGVDIEARLPGRRQQGLALLSGGERSLAAVALIFALLKVSPTPFCVLDEVDAMLDESNVGRFIDLLGELSQNTQFVIITHNRNTIQVADVIYGVTMGRDSTSQMISLKLEEVDETYLE